MSKFIPKSELLPQRWYAVNRNLAPNGVPAPGLNPGEGMWDSVVGGPFGSRAQGLRWLSANPQASGPAATIEFCYSGSERSKVPPSTGA